MLKFSRSVIFSPTATVISLLVFLIVLLRLPTLTEPYWYGDEGIYLTIGNAMNKGAVLYKDIVDHKTPLIYYFARVGSQLNFRLLLTFWMMAASVAFFGILYRLTKRLWISGISAGIFILLTTLPLLEGNIPNGELFVMGFVLVGVWLFLQSKLGAAFFLSNDVTLSKRDHRQFAAWSLVTGVCMGGAILTKVPALFDAAAIFFIGWLVGCDQQLAAGRKFKPGIWLNVLQNWTALFLGVAMPILGSVLYFVAIGAGKEYLDFGLLYNFHYVQNWSLGHLPSWQQTLFTLPFKALITALALLGLSITGKWLPRPLRWSTGWFFLALFASILSNRPYPHYILQVIPPMILVIGLVWHYVTPKQRTKNYVHTVIASSGVLAVCCLAIWFVWTSLRIGHYPVMSYYQSFFKLLTRQQSAVAYRNTFNAYLADNYAANQILHTADDRYLFIWGTNPMLYAISGKQPVGRFTVSFHIHDLKLYQETIEHVQSVQPIHIVVMKDEQTPLPGLQAFLTTSYERQKDFSHFTIWKKRSTAASSPKVVGQ